MRAETQWRPKAAERTYLDGGTLAREARAGASTTSSTFPPSVPRVASGRRACPSALPGDQGADEARALVHDTAPLLEDLAILGQPLTVLHLAFSARVMGFVVRLCEVGPSIA